MFFQEGFLSSAYIAGHRLTNEKADEHCLSAHRLDD
jgi:hypothetical protein